jgi:hypothetical protein
MYKIDTHNNKICQEVFSNLPKKYLIRQTNIKTLDIAYKFFNEAILKLLKKVLTIIKPTKEEINLLNSMRLGRQRNTYIIQRLIKDKIDVNDKNNKKYFIAIGLMTQLTAFFIIIAGNKREGIKLYNSTLMRIDFISKNKVYSMQYREYCKRSLQYHKEIIQGDRKYTYTKLKLSIIVVKFYLYMIDKSKEHVKEQLESRIQECSNEIQLKKKESQTSELWEEFHGEYINRLYAQRVIYSQLLQDTRLDDNSMNIINLIEICPISRRRFVPWLLDKTMQSKSTTMILFPCIKNLMPKTGYRLKFNNDCVKEIIMSEETLSNNKNNAHIPQKNYDTVVRFNDTHNIQDAFAIAGSPVFVKKGFILCPFHNDSKPSMHLFENDKMAHCFSCGKNIKSPIFWICFTGNSVRDLHLHD